MATRRSSGKQRAVVMIAEMRLVSSKQSNNDCAHLKVFEMSRTALFPAILTWACFQQRVLGTRFCDSVQAR
jgi:hypothetical protein